MRSGAARGERFGRCGSRWFGRASRWRGHRRLRVGAAGRVRACGCLPRGRHPRTLRRRALRTGAVRRHRPLVGSGVIPLRRHCPRVAPRRVRRGNGAARRGAARCVSARRVAEGRHRRTAPSRRRHRRKRRAGRDRGRKRAALWLLALSLGIGAVRGRRRAGRLRGVRRPALGARRRRAVRTPGRRTALPLGRCRVRPLVETRRRAVRALVGARRGCVVRPLVGARRLWSIRPRPAGQAAVRARGWVPVPVLLGRQGRAVRPRWRVGAWAEVAVAHETSGVDGVAAWSRLPARVECLVSWAARVRRGWRRHAVPARRRGHGSPAGRRAVRRRGRGPA